MGDIGIDTAEIDEPDYDQATVLNQDLVKGRQVRLIDDFSPERSSPPPVGDRLRFMRNALEEQTGLCLHKFGRIASAIWTVATPPSPAIVSRVGIL